MKKFLTIFIFIIICISVIFSQEIKKITVKKSTKDYVETHFCKDSKLGILVFYSTIENLNFEIVYPKAAIKSVTPQKEHNRYVLCVEPTNEQNSNYNVKIYGAGYEITYQKIDKLLSKEQLIFEITKDIDTKPTPAPTPKPEPKPEQKTEQKLELGQEYQGGRIAYLDNTGKHGWIITKGNATQQPLTWDQAIEVCKKLNIEKYNDWRLPSKGELEVICKNKDIIGKYGTYWSSDICTGCSSYHYYYVNISVSGCEIKSEHRSRTFYVIAIRNF